MSDQSSVTQFDHAIVRRPAQSVTQGLRDVDRGDPDLAAVVAEHDAYIAAMNNVGVSVTVLPSLEEYPDSVFVEDPALVFGEGAILLRPGAASRRGEVKVIEPELRRLFPRVLSISDSGFVEGGDVLVTDEHVMIGLSDRTDEAGAKALMHCLEELGRTAVIVQTPKDVLHFKTDCSLLDEETVFTTRRLAVSNVFSRLKTVLVPDGEEAAANALRINDVVLIGKGFPRSIELLGGLGYNVVALPTEEIGKIDAG